MASPQIGSNLGPALDGPAAENTKIVFNRYSKILADRKHIGARMRDVMQDGKASGFRAAEIRLGHRLSKLTPEKREEAVNEMRTALRQFGFDVVDEPELERDADLMALVSRGQEIQADRKQISKRVKELSEQAEMWGVDFQAIRDILSSPMGRLGENPEAREERFARFDRMATFLGWW